MKKTSFNPLLIMLMVFQIFSSCSKDDEINNTPVVADFEYSLDSNEVPAELTLTNKSTGAIKYDWTFTGGTPSSSSKKNPGVITYSVAGEYTITLTASNDNESKTVSKKITLTEPSKSVSVVADFEYSLDSNEVPAKLTLTNKSTGATKYDWTFTGGTPSSSSKKNPGVITYSAAGEYTITLTASNDNESKIVSKKITLTSSNPTSGEIISYSNIKLGGVDVQSTVGSVFSTKTGLVYKDSQISSENGSEIDIAFVGINGMQFFESPKDINQWGLKEIPNATSTDFINYIKGSSINFTVEMFDDMSDATQLKDLVIEADNESFSSDAPKIILFKNENGKKGAIKITEIVGGKSGYIIFDLKMEK